MTTMSDQILMPASMGQALVCWVWVYRCGSHCICMRLGDIMRCDRVLGKLDSFRDVLQPVHLSKDDLVRCACSMLLMSHECCVMHDDSLNSAVSGVPEGQPRTTMARTIPAAVSPGSAGPCRRTRSFHSSHTYIDLDVGH